MDTTEDIPRFSYVSCAALTDVGRKRKNNEDNYGTFPDAGVFCVADGMGGARDGEVASRIVVEHLAGALRNWEKISPPIPLEDRLALLDKCLDAASLWINQYAASHDANGCGTTFVGVVLDPGKPGHAVALHAGDSRLYRIHRHKITQITRDHSVANMTGVKDENELNPVFRNMILRAVGIKTSVELERTSFEVVPGDWVLICSDGLTKMVDDKSIAKIVASADGGKTAAHMLVAEANRCGGRDNVTVVLLHVGELPPALPVHARLTEAEFLACMGVAPAEAAATTETAFTMPTGESSTEQTAVPAENGTANADGWLSEDEDSDLPSASVPVGEEGDGGATGKREEVDKGGPGIVPAELEDGPDAKTTEDIPPPERPDAPDNSSEARTTEDMAPVIVGRRSRTLLPVVLGAAVLAAVAGVGIRQWQNAREKAAIRDAELKAEQDQLADAVAKFRQASKTIRGNLPSVDAVAKSPDPESFTNLLAAATEDFRFAYETAFGAGVAKDVIDLEYGAFTNDAARLELAIAGRRHELNVAVNEFTGSSTNALAHLQTLAEPNGEIATSKDPASFSVEIAAAWNALKAAWTKAEAAGVTNRALYEAKLDSYATLSNRVATAIAKRRGVLDAEDLTRAKQAFEEKADEALGSLRKLIGPTGAIVRSDNPDAYLVEIAKATKTLDTAWKLAGEAGVEDNVRKAKYNEFSTCSNNVVAAISARTKVLKGEYGAYKKVYGECEGKSGKINDADSYGDLLKEIADARKALPSYASSPWREEYDGLRKKYDELKASISVQTAKIEVRNAGDVALAVTLGKKTETIGKGESRTFDKLAVWTDYKLSAAVSGRDVSTKRPARPEAAPPGSAGFQPAAVDYELLPAESIAATKRPDTTVEVAFSAKYKGDPTLIVKNGNAVVIKVNGVAVDPGKTYATNGAPRSGITLAYECDNADWELPSNANRLESIALGDAGANKEIAAPTLVAKPKPATAADLKPSPADLPVSTDPKAKQTPLAGGEARTSELEKTKKKFCDGIDKYKDILETIASLDDKQGIPLFYYTACFMPHPNEGQHVAMMDDLRLLASDIRIASLSTPEVIDDITKDKYNLFINVVRKFRDSFSLEDTINGFEYSNGEEKKRCTEKDMEAFRKWKQGVLEWACL
ncbi:MAG: protein phosphatase 2C domain-containing protein [Kiritimatiellae bacterium]|nr:protein phosphatase 2C domain-containing protein [Kiritimatiellia bacterium]